MQLGLFDLVASDEVMPTPAQRKACELSFQFMQACDAAGFDYRGYAVEAGERVYVYSPKGSPAGLRRMPITRWDRTPAGLRGVA